MTNQLPTMTDLDKAVKNETLVKFLLDRGYRKREIDEMPIPQFLKVVTEETDLALKGQASITIAVRNTRVHTYDSTRDGPVAVQRTKDGGAVFHMPDNIPEDEDSVKRRFDNWMKDLDDLVERELGLRSIDLGDICPLRDWFDDGVTARNAAKRFIRAQKQENGF